MATLLDSKLEDPRAYMSVKFNVVDAFEGEVILNGARQAVLEYLETQGFYPEGVEVSLGVMS